MTDGIPLIHADDRIGASGMQPKSPFAPPPPTIVPPSDGIGLQAAAGRKPVAMRAVPSHDQLADELSKWGISAYTTCRDTIRGCAGERYCGHWWVHPAG